MPLPWVALCTPTLRRATDRLRVFSGTFLITVVASTGDVKRTGAGRLVRLGRRAYVMVACGVSALVPPLPAIWCGGLLRRTIFSRWLFVLRRTDAAGVTEGGKFKSVGSRSSRSLMSPSCERKAGDGVLGSVDSTSDAEENVDLDELRRFV